MSTEDQVATELTDSEQTVNHGQENAEIGQQQSEVAAGDDANGAQSEQSTESKESAAERKIRRQKAANKAINEELARERALREQLESELNKHRQSQQSTSQDDDGNRRLVPIEQVEAMVHERERMKQAANTAQQVLEAGKGIDGFNDALDDLDAVLPLFRNGKQTVYLEAIFDLKPTQAAKMIDWLGNNPEEAETLKGLNERQLGRRLAELEAQINKPKEVKQSAAPDPITPVKPRGGAGSSRPKTAEEYAAELRASRWK